MKKTINIIGSTGTIGINAVEVLQSNPEIFKVNILLGFSNYQLLAKQADLLKPKYIFLQKEFVEKLKQLLPNNFNIFAIDDLSYILSNQSKELIDISLISVKSFAGLDLCWKFIPYSKRISLANKESIICGGKILLEHLFKHNCELIPVDSEHNTIFQLIHNLAPDTIQEIIITASGGPFWGKNKQELSKIDFETAAKHPKWHMGHEISINSATLMNKAQELIEADFLFGKKNIKISAIVHPQALIHAIINLNNGLSIIGAANNDMKFHIANSFFHPYDNKPIINSLNWNKISEFKFFTISDWHFNFIDIAHEIINKKDLSKSIIMNAANECALQLFKNKKISFLQINDFVCEAILNSQYAQPKNLEEIFAIDKETRLKLQN